MDSDIINLYTTLAKKIESVRENRKTNKYDFNFFSALAGKKTHLEMYHSNFLAYLLGPENGHDCNHIFLKTFLEMIREKVKTKHSDHNAIAFITNWLKEDLESSTVITEKPVGSGRIDIEISGKLNRRKIFIENKIRSSEGKNQVLYYFNHYNNSHKCEFMGIYLTKSGCSPVSIKDDIIALSYSDILKWLSTCIEKEFKDCPNVSVPIIQYTTELKKELGMNKEQFTEDLKGELSRNPSTFLKIVSCQQAINDTIDQLIVEKRSLFLDSLLKRIEKELDNNENFTIENSVLKTSEKDGTIDIVNKIKNVKFSLYMKYSFPEFEDGGKGLWWGIFKISNNTPFQGLNLNHSHWEGVQLNNQTNDFIDDVRGSQLIIEAESTSVKKQELLDYVSKYIIGRLTSINLMS